MSGGKGLLSSTAIYTLTNALSAGIPFLMLPILTRVLSPEEYGIVAMFGVVVTVLGAFTGLSVHGALGIRYFEQDRFDLPRYVASCLAILLVSTCAVLLALGLLLPVIEHVTKVPGPWLLAAVLLSGAQFLIQIQLTLWQVSRQPWKYGALRITQSATDAALSLLAVLGLGWAWQGRLGGIAGAALLCAGLAACCLRAGAWCKGPPERAYVKNALQFGVPLIPHVIGGMLVLMVDRFLISNVLDVASTGIYMVAMQIGLGMGLLTDSFNKAFAPWLIASLKRDDPARDRAIVRFTYAYFAGVAALALILGLLAPALLALLVGPQYQSAAGIVVYITFGFAFGGMYYMVTNYIFYAGKTQRLAYLTFACGALNVVITFGLLKSHGLAGAAQGFMLSQALTFLGTWWLAQQSHPMPWRAAMGGA